MTKEEFMKEFSELIRETAGELDTTANMKDVEFKDYGHVLQMIRAILTWNVRASSNYKDMQEQMDSLDKDINTLRGIVGE